MLLHVNSAHLEVVRESWVSYGRCLLIQKSFCAVYDYEGKAVLHVPITSESISFITVVVIMGKRAETKMADDGIFPL